MNKILKVISYSIIAVFFSIALSGCDAANTQSIRSQQTPQKTITNSSTAPSVQQDNTSSTEQPKTPQTTTCPDGYYKNSSGVCVHSPNNDPAGATAKCRDGSYSYSQHRSGTCSGHGGVAQWL